jgi:hypothetical protein
MLLRCCPRATQSLRKFHAPLFSTRLAFSSRPAFSTRLTGMPPCRRSSSGFHGVRARLNGTFYAELCAGGFLLTLGTYDTPELAARAYDVVAWRLRRPRRALNFPNMGSLEEMEFLTPPPRLITDEGRHRHRQAQRRLVIADRDKLPDAVVEGAVPEQRPG